MAQNSGNPAPELSFRTRLHFWQHLKNHQDLLANVVIAGGGIVGAGLLRELGLQGIPLVFLFEKNDFASATSGKSSKLIHAGIRYLEQFWNSLKKFHFRTAWINFKFVLAASRERKILRRLAPHLISSKSILFVLGKKDRRNSFGVFIGVWLYYLIQILQGQFFSPPQFSFFPNGIKKIAPEIDASQVKAAFSFWDSETDDARLVLENIQSGHEYGGYALNYVEIIEVQQNKNGVRVKLKNRESGEELHLQTRIFINATGPFIDEFRSVFQGGNSPEKPFIERVAGSHIDIYPALTQNSYYITAQDARLVFVLHRMEDGLSYTRIGTTERPLSANEPSEGIMPTQTEIDYLKNLVLEFFPGTQFIPENVVRTDAGIRALRVQRGSSAYEKTREHEIIQEGSVYHVVGVKLTDYRRVAAEILKLIPWNKLNLRISDPLRSEWVALRQESNPRMYIETDILEMSRRTMIVHWDDYVHRRRGVGPLVLQKINPEAYKKEFQTLSEIMNWSPEAQDQEFKIN